MHSNVSLHLNDGFELVCVVRHRLNSELGQLRLRLSAIFDWSSF
jgi:hypothetical protein